MQAVIYVKESSRYSNVQQVEDCLNLLKQKGYILSQIYIEKHGETKQWDMILENNHRIVIVKSLSLLSCKSEDILSILHKMHLKSSSILTVDYNIDTTLNSDIIHSYLNSIDELNTKLSIH